MAVKNKGRPPTSQFVSQHRPRWPCWEGVTTFHSGVRSGVSSLEKFRSFRCKFLLSGALSARKLTPVKVQNTTHFHSRLDYVHPVRHNSQDYDGMRDRGARKQDVPAETGRVTTAVNERSHSFTCHSHIYPLVE